MTYFEVGNKPVSRRRFDSRRMPVAPAYDDNLQTGRRWGFFKGFMKSTRKQRREEHRAQKRQAEAMRKENGLCEHSDDERQYASNAESDADTAPAKVCQTCLKPMLIVKMVSAAFAKSDVEGVPMDICARGAFANYLR